MLIGESLGSMAKKEQFIRGDQYFSKKRLPDNKKKNSSSDEDDKSQNDEKREKLENSLLKPIEEEAN